MVTAEEAARLFLHYVWKLHSLPKHVVSNHGPQFVALFTKELYKLLGVWLSSSIAWHPQIDGQTEHVRATGAQDSRRILRYITVCDYDITHLQENPQRLE